MIEKGSWVRVNQPDSTHHGKIFKVTLVIGPNFISLKGEDGLLDWSGYAPYVEEITEEEATAHSL